jgi:hypothetical protein
VTLLPLLEAEAVAFAIVSGLWLHGRATGKQTLRRVIKTAEILTGAEGCTWKRPKQLARAVWRGSSEALPAFCRLVIVPGVFCPVPGPVDEAAAAVAIGLVAVSPTLRVKVLAAWKASQERI